MRRFHWLLLAAWLPGAALAQDGARGGGAVIRIEAKRGAAATAEAAAGWSARFPDVVTFRLPGGWTGIGLGPQGAAEAAARLEQLKAEGRIPADSFVAEPGTNATLTAVLPATGSATETATTDETAAPAGDEATTGGEADGAVMAAEPAETPAAPVDLVDRYLRFEALQDRTDAENTLERWRETFPDAGLWQLPGGSFAVALGPLTEAAGTAWLAAFKSAGAAPRDAFLATGAELGTPEVEGATPDLPAPPAAAGEMPPLDQVQRALRWAGFYDGDIDGKGGPMTEAAINAEILAERLSPDPATAMRGLIDRRADWRDEMGISQLQDAHTGLSAMVPMDRLAFDRDERALAIYGPRDGSGAALILFSQPGGQQDLLDLSGLVIALGWVPDPARDVKPGAITLDGRNDSHIGHAEGRVRDGRAEGFVLIWPVSDAQNQRRVAAELSDTFARFAPAANDPQAEAPAAGATPALLPAPVETAPGGN